MAVSLSPEQETRTTKETAAKKIVLMFQALHIVNIQMVRGYNEIRELEIGGRSFR
tara:strand:- start:534 stop:698 length:165 start_codon:yes stop_codon:yes gene_type:complete